VSLSVATWSSSLPVAYRLFLPKECADDTERRKRTEVPEKVEFQTKPDIALDQIRAAVAANLHSGVVLADAAYGINTEFREELTKLGLQYAVGVQSSMTVNLANSPYRQSPEDTWADLRAYAAHHGPSTRSRKAVGDEHAFHCLQGNHLA